jgi:SOS-response transcriptional repressor LexA
VTCGCATAAPAPDDEEGCSGGEAFALQVLGDDMAPEFEAGEIVIIEPDGAIGDGRFVLARHGGEWLLRQLRAQAGTWVLHALNNAHGKAPDLPLADLSVVHGVVIQKAVPGRRRLSKSYL